MIAIRRLHRALLAAVLAVAACSGPPKKQPDVVPPGGGSDVSGPGSGTAPPVAKARAVEQPPLVPRPLAEDPTKVTIHRLSNGMTVFLSPDKEQPSIVAHVAARAGSGNDPKQSTGLAHYLEHVLFKGTSKLGTLDYGKEKPHLDRIAQLYADLRKPGADRDKILKEIDAETQKSAEYAVPNELDQLYARMGITGLNAFTANDATVYVSEIPKNRVAQWARVEASRYVDPVFRLFWPELEAVYEEKNRSIDNAAWRTQEAFLRALFPNHGYGWSSGIGEIDHLKSPAYQDMEAFFQRYYTPQNMAILLAGDVDESVLPVLEAEFGKLSRPAGDAFEEGKVTPMTGGRVEVKVTVPSEEGVLLGWQLVPATHADRLAIELMDLLLLDGQSGMLARDLLLPQKVADAGCNPTFQREAGYYELHADALDGQKHEDLERLLLDLVAKLQRGDFTDGDVATAILTAEINQQRLMESNNGRMSLMQGAFMVGEPWTNVVSKIERFKKITKADIVRVANQYLAKNFVVVKKVKGAEKPPKINKPGITAVKVDPTRRSAYATAILDMPVTPIEPVAIAEGTDYTRGTLPTGQLVSVVNKRNGLFTLSHDYDVGRTDEKLVCIALEVLKVSGAGKRTAEQVTRQLHELGVSVDTGCGKDGSSITISGIDRNLEAAMTLLREWLADPLMDDTTVKAAVQKVLTDRANALTTPQSISAAAAAFARLGDRSDFLVTATNKQLVATTPAQLKKVLASFLKWKHRTAYFGPRDAKAASGAIVLGDGKVATAARRTMKYRAPNQVFLVDQETAQTHVWLVWPRKPATDAERAVGTLFSEYESPILYQEVREARGLAYTVFGGYGAGGRKGDDGAVSAYVGTQGDKTHDALEAVLATMKAPVDDTRLQLAKDTLAQGHRVDRIAPRAIPSFVYAWEDQGEKSDPRDGRVKRTLAVTKADLEKWMKEALAGPVIVSVTGDRKKLDEAKLKKLANITVVPTAKLFGY
ncbi:MAG: insulinase family protein [Deltaproteobacteria bacterium]|nr:insulinase family protein [Deltaproteobacteria bacterium]